MPVAQPFTTDGVFTGMPDCFEKVDVSGFDFWTTASGFNKDSGGTPTQSQIDQSLQLVGKLFWNLYRITCITGDLDVPSSVETEVVVGNEPVERVCSGSFVSVGDAMPYYGNIDLTLNTGFARFYNGSTDDEANFIGYGQGVIAFPGGDIVAPIAQASIDTLIDPQSYLGGYADDDVDAGFKKAFTYVILDGIHFLWVGIIADDPVAGITTFVDSSLLKAWAEFTTGLDYQAQITGLEFWTYP